MVTIGTPTLVSIAEQEMNNWTDDQYIAYAKNHTNVITMLRGKDWLMPFFCQYDERYQPSIAETSWFALIKKMISEGQLYLSCFPCERWAFADVNRNQNFENVRNAGFHIEKPSGYEDAIFSTPGKITMRKLYFTDEESLGKVNDTIDVELVGPVEFGTQSIPKTALMLSMGYPLMRVCYDPGIDFMKPCIGILYYANARKQNNDNVSFKTTEFLDS